jgi:hypothetical protein
MFQRAARPRRRCLNAGCLFRITICFSSLSIRISISRISWSALHFNPIYTFRRRCCTDSAVMSKCNAAKSSLTTSPLAALQKPHLPCDIDCLFILTIKKEWERHIFLLASLFYPSLTPLTHLLLHGRRRSYQCATSPRAARPPRRCLFAPRTF